MTQTHTRDPDEIEREIRRTQDDMSRTVDRIGEQMTPRSMLNALLDKAEGNDIDARRLLDGARRNPLALGLISVGTIWLISDYDAKPSAFTSSSGSGSSGQSTGRYDYDPDHRGYVEHMSRIQRLQDEDDLAYQRRRDEARGSYLMIERDHDEDHKSYRSRLDDATKSMREKRDRFADTARERSHTMAQSARDGSRQVAQQGRRVANKGRDLYYENPLLGGFAAALVGAVAGSALPVTRTEREQLGPQGASVIDQAEAKARNLGDKALQKKDEVVDKADNAMSESGQSSSGSSQSGASSSQGQGSSTRTI